MSAPSKTIWQSPVWPVLVLAAGVAVRFWFGSLGYNFDLGSWHVAADLMAQGKSVYANTPRYNYGPVWMNVLHVLDLLAGRNPDIFRWLLIGFLSAVDIGISVVLWRKFGGVVATLFFLNPVSLIITGYHNQFDNLAILMGLWAVLLFGDDFEKPLDRRKFLALVLIGLSLMTKHLLFVFPFWLALKQRGLFNKCVVLAVPGMVFLAGFIPYWSAGHAGIIANVFLYRGSMVVGAFFYSLLVPELFKFSAAPTLYWILALVFFGFLCRKKNSLDSLLIYLIALLATSPALANQYLVIPLASIFVFMNPFFAAYLVLAALHLCVSAQGMYLLKGSGGCAVPAVACLFSGLVWMFWRVPIVRFTQNCLDEIGRQFGRKA